MSPGAAVTGSRPALGWQSLTPTELTVAAAVAEGLSNPQIAARMFISRRTVTTHLTSIFREASASRPGPSSPPSRSATTTTLTLDHLVTRRQCMKAAQGRFPDDAGHEADPGRSHWCQRALVAGSGSMVVAGNGAVSAPSRTARSNSGWFGHDRVARVEVTFRSGERPNGQFDEPSALLLADKAEFGTSRVRRWFGRDSASFSTPCSRNSALALGGAPVPCW